MAFAFSFLTKHTFSITHTHTFQSHNLRSFTLSKNYKWNYAVLAHFPRCMSEWVQTFAPARSYLRLWAHSHFYARLCRIHSCFSFLFGFFLFYSIFIRFRFQFMHIKVLLDEPHLCIHYTNWLNVDDEHWILTNNNNNNEERKKEWKKSYREKRLNLTLLVKIFSSQRFGDFCSWNVILTNIEVERKKRVRSKSPRMK